MKKVYLKNNDKILLNIKDIEISNGIVNKIINQEYINYESNDEFLNKNFSEILQILNDGYSINDLNQLGINKVEIKDFLSFLESSNLTIDNAKALNMYSCDSSIILLVKNGLETKQSILLKTDEIMRKFLVERGISENQISEAINFVKNINYSKPLYENFYLSKDFLTENNFPKVSFSTINTAIKQYDTVNRVDSIIDNIDDSLSKSFLKDSVLLYRALKIENENNILGVLDDLIFNKGYTSTSLIYEASFAKYQNYNVVIEMYAPKGTQGILLSPFSDYDSVEQEILLASNFISVLDIKNNVVDEFGNDKTILSAVVLTENIKEYDNLLFDDKNELEFD